MTEQTTISTQLLIDRAEILRVVDGIDNAKDWATCRSYFTGDIPADDFVGAWSTGLYADKKSHHMRSNHRIEIDGDRAEVSSKGYALNILSQPNGSDLWEVWDDYIHTLDRTAQGWKCSGMTFIVTHARGNEKVRDFVPGQ